MITLSHLTVLVLGELFVALLVLSGVLSFFAMQRKARIRKSAHHLAERVQADKPQRMERLKKLLAERYGYAGGELDQSLHSVTQAEMRLYQNIINGLLKDDQITLQQIDVDVENFVLAYQALNLSAGSEKPTVKTPSAENGDEIQHLKEENERLSEELKVTMDTMGRMLNEYSSMFAGGVGDTFEKDIVTAKSEDEPADAAARPVEIDESADDPQMDNDFEIPDYSADEVMSEDLKSSDGFDDYLEEDADSSVEDEVSEIIDEVMGIADEMNQEETPPEESDAPPNVSESLVDDLEQVDIEIPEVDDAALSEAEVEPGSLEEEWAKLLEEDAASKTETKNDK
jgi:hypothetical protein